jgi:hypothetical protein
MNLSNNNAKYINILSNSNTYDFERTYQIYISIVSIISKQYHISISDVLHDITNVITSAAETLIGYLVDSLHSYSYKIFDFSEKIAKRLILAAILLSTAQIAVDLIAFSILYSIDQTNTYTDIYFD